jgi:hypothetical protein
MNELGHKRIINTSNERQAYRGAVN